MIGNKRLNSLLYLILMIPSLTLVLFWGTLLAVLPTDFLLVNSLYIKKEPPSNKLEVAIALLPKKLALFKVKELDDSCHGSFSADKVSHIVLLTDILYENFSDNNPEVDKELVKALIRSYVGKGCDINDIHPVTEMGPIHTALIFAGREPDFVFELIEMGADLNLKFPANMGHNLAGKPAIAFPKQVVEGGKSPYIHIYEKVLLSR